ncbi:hypothetical protein [Psychrosphaera sp. 1_MG-2023]|nr:hypothetical protein [Psychrosphaera sp. 1_MG-2023]
MFVFSIIAIFQYERMTNKWDPQAYKPQYTRCASVYVRKSPHPCNAGDLIYIDSDVAHKYCTSNVIAKFDDSVYCQYSGFREDLADITTSVVSDKPKL